MKSADGRISGGMVNTAEGKKFLWREPEELEDWHNRTRMKFSAAKHKVMCLGSTGKVMLLQKLVAH